MYIGTYMFSTCTGTSYTTMATHMIIHCWHSVIICSTCRRSSSPITPSSIPLLLAPRIPYSDHVSFLLLKDTPKTLANGQLAVACGEMHGPVNQSIRIPRIHSHTESRVCLTTNWLIKDMVTWSKDIGDSIILSFHYGYKPWGMQLRNGYGKLHRVESNIYM